jgi:hypothetical protein
MSCCNNNRPIIVYPPCTADCPEPDAVTAENVNLAGWGALESQDGQTLNFRGIAAGDYTTVNYDPDSKAIVIDIDPALIDGTIPDATELVKGKIALASSAEVISGLSDSKAVTPYTMSLITATVARRGFVELATSIEAEAGLDSERAVTPSALSFVLSGLIQTATYDNAAARAMATPSHEGQVGIQLDTGAIYYANGISVGEWDGVNLDGPAISNTVNFITSTWQLNSVSIPANSVLATSATIGQPSYYGLTEFFGPGSSSIDYTISNDVESRTFDANTVTVAELADVVATFIRDIGAFTKPTFGV